MPLQNTIHGGVRETLDCIASWYSSSKKIGKSPLVMRHDSEHSPRIIADLDLSVNHCLIVKKGTKMEEIRWIRSHEQVRETHSETKSLLTIMEALGQCAQFLTEHLPSAKRIPVASTAAAAASLVIDVESSPNGGGASGTGAAIGSKSVISLNPDLVVLRESIQAVKGENIA